MWGSTSVVIVFASLARGGGEGRRQEEDNVVGNFPFLFFNYYLICFPSFIIQLVSLATHLLDMLNKYIYSSYIKLLTAYPL